jgi:hypothetical protein
MPDTAHVVDDALAQFIDSLEIHGEGTVTNPPGVDVEAAIAAAEAARSQGAKS